MEHKHAWLQRCSEEDLHDLEGRLGNPFAESWWQTAAALYLALMPVALVLAVLAKAVERSGHWEIMSWLALAMPCIPAYFTHRKRTAKRELWMAVNVELGRR
jgi:hypothetical protein